MPPPPSRQLAGTVKIMTQETTTAASACPKLFIPGQDFLVDNWLSALGGDSAAPPPRDPAWRPVELPHNWEDYHSYGGASHGNLHGTAWYRRPLDLRPPDETGDCPLLVFEGVGSYADVWVDGAHCGRHAGGKTAFWVSPTPAAIGKKAAELLVRASHPELIRDLPHVCGGCWGSPNSEGNQPFGIHRPVSVEWSGPVRVLPFGLYAFVPDWEADEPEIRLWIEIMNFRDTEQSVSVDIELIDSDGKRVRQFELHEIANAGTPFQRIEADLGGIGGLLLWSPESPALYRVRACLRHGDGAVSHFAECPLGLRRIRWPLIIAPNADRNTRCVPEGVKLISNGHEPITPENNGFTRVLAGTSDRVGLAPCGVRVYQQSGEDETATCRIELDLVNHTASEQTVTVEAEILNESGTVFLQQFLEHVVLDARGRRTIQLVSDPIHFPQRWHPWEPYLHKVVVDILGGDEELLERSSTPFGFIDTGDTVNTGQPVWEQRDGGCLPGVGPRDLPPGEKVFRINDRPVFLNGGAEYETLLGNDHAFTAAQIDARAGQILAAGFNAFRDAHHPHNLRYYRHWDVNGIPCWTQFGTHLYFDTPAFRDNFRAGLVEWVRERRAHPCIIAWGLQNESVLPEAFANACAELARAWDPTARVERLCLTCNGGKGADWNVPQEWSGTYGGNCADYDPESLQMVGEYGAWRTFGVHRDTAYRGDENDRSESWACHAMGTKIAIAHAQRDRCAGHWHWIFNSFPNPGRSPHVIEGPGDGAFGPINNKGLVTVAGEPSDLFYLYRAAFADPRHSPMVYVVSPTWPDRFREPGVHDNLRVFSNCEVVELFNGHRSRSLGVRRNPGPGLPFRWDRCRIDEDLLYAEGRIGGRVVASHYIRQAALPPSDGWSGLVAPDPGLLAPPAPPARVLYAVNCGGDRPWTDASGTAWLPEAAAAREGLRFSSWAHDFPALDPDVGSIGRITTPLVNDPAPGAPLFASFRYGRHRLVYDFAVDAAGALVECFFTEPWYGVGGGLRPQGWRLFDVALNGRTVLRDFDVWRACGGRHHAVVRKAFTAATAGGRIRLTFPRVASGQAVISAIRLSV
jgi:hypothetical protein